MYLSVCFLSTCSSLETQLWILGHFCHREIGSRPPPLNLRRYGENSFWSKVTKGHIASSLFSGTCPWRLEWPEAVMPWASLDHRETWRGVGQAWFGATLNQGLRIGWKDECACHYSKWLQFSVKGATVTYFWTAGGNERREQLICNAELEVRAQRGGDIWAVLENEQELARQKTEGELDAGLLFLSTLK